MLDREDIDALLIGRLYGELSSADEARLQAHLAGASPQAQADKRALEDMTSARSAVRESRLLAEQVDPPQSISAMLMQEAARRAPKQRSESEGWFARFVRSFVAHPAMAAAATLVLVVAVGGTLYMRNGKQLAEDRVSAPEIQAQMSAPNADRGYDYAPTETASAGSSAGSAVALAPGNADTGALAGAQQAQGEGIVVGLEDATKGQAPSVKSPAPRGIVVSTPDHMPKELDEAQAPRKDSRAARDSKESEKQDKLGMVDDDRQEGADPRAMDPYAGAGASKSEEAPAKQKKTAPAKPAAPVTTAPEPTPAPPPPAEAPKNAQPSSSEAKQHKQIVAEAKAQRCANAASLAVQLEDSNQSYYDSEVKNDRDLKACMQSINAKREQVATQRAKAKKARVEAEQKAGKKPATTSTDSK